MFLIISDLIKIRYKHMTNIRFKIFDCNKSLFLHLSIRSWNPIWDIIIFEIIFFKLVFKSQWLVELLCFLVIISVKLSWWGNKITVVVWVNECLCKGSMFLMVMFLTVLELWLDNAVGSMSFFVVVFWVVNCWFLMVLSIWSWDSVSIVVVFVIIFLNLVFESQWLVKLLWDHSWFFWCWNKVIIVVWVYAYVSFLLSIWPWNSVWNIVVFEVILFELVLKSQWLVQLLCFLVIISIEFSWWCNKITIMVRVDLYVRLNLSIWPRNSVWHIVILPIIFLELVFKSQWLEELLWFLVIITP